MSSPLRIIFYGTPEFAVSSLSALVENKFNIVAVVTSVDKPSGRGQKLTHSAVKEFALEKNIPVLQPNNMKDDDFIEQIKEINPDLQIVVAFRMMPEKVWRLPGKGTFNLHASLLPQYRGAAPINWAIMNGETETGVTTFFLQHEIDTGDIIFQEKTSIGHDETAGELHDRLKLIGAELVVKTACAISDSAFKLKSQSGNSDTPLRSAPKLNKENTRLNCKMLFSDAYNFIRGLSPYPAAYAELYNRESGLSITIKIFKSQAKEYSHNFNPGTIESDNKSYLRIYFLRGYLELEEIQLAGRNKVVVKDFLNGFKLEGHWSLRS
ncbi:MAG TPA: methionyl-tRNA formyltransferase [Bacteroidia bacterium]|nr:methionyl-tRNA formyltransferase [Bacteroidia bacterium]HNS11151.1 methionyl-tRNA formyltransferase [Bacteroidia bacterium]